VTDGVARYRATVAYDGTDYYGFQRQAGDLPTIQGVLEGALERVVQQRVTVNGAGRTDTGVHATGQVIAFDAVWRHGPRPLWRAINANLPPTIALLTLDLAAPDFHPRFDARSRAYEYTFYVAPVRQPCLNRYAWHVAHLPSLDLGAIQAAAARLVGTHDFATFGTSPQGDNTIREVLRSEVVALPGLTPNEQVFRYTIRANAFLYRMVRRIVGALVRVGGGTLALDAFEAAFRAADGTWPNGAAPAHGLCLTEIIY
jgi:tRNA pseudouridine38-40 synthase